MKAAVLKRKKRGFTLIELIVVIAILAILAAIAIPRYNESRAKSATTAHNSNVRILEGAAQNYIANEGAKEETWVTGSEAGEKIKEYVDKPEEIKVPKGAKNNVKTDATPDYYTVEIEADGTVNVTPAAVALD